MESTTSRPAHVAYLPYTTNSHSYQNQQPPHQQQYQIHTVSPPYTTADNNGGVSAAEIHHHTSGSGGVGYTSLNEGGDGGEEVRKRNQLEVSIDIDDIPGKGPGGVPEKYFTVSVKV